MTTASLGLIAGIGPLGTPELLIIAVLFGILLVPVVIAVVVVVWVVKKNARERGAALPPTPPLSPDKRPSSGDIS